MVWDDPSADIQAGKAARASDVRKIQDNITAQANGDTGAPKTSVESALRTSSTDETEVLLVGPGNTVVTGPPTGVVFAAEKDGGTIAAGAAATWTEIVDTGDDFDGTTFTVPADGVYEFTIHIAQNTSTNSSGISFAINGTNDETLIPSTQDESGVDRTMVKSLTSGDTITIKESIGLGATGIISGWYVEGAVLFSGKAYWIGRRLT